MVKVDRENMGTIFLEYIESDFEVSLLRRPAEALDIFTPGRRNKMRCFRNGSYKLSKELLHISYGLTGCLGCCCTTALLIRAVAW